MELQPRFSNGTFKVFLYVASRSPHSSQLQSRRSAISRRRYLRYLRDMQENFWNSRNVHQTAGTAKSCPAPMGRKCAPHKSIFWSGQTRLPRKPKSVVQVSRNRFSQYCRLQEIGFSQKSCDEKTGWFSQQARQACVKPRSFSLGF